MVIKEKKINKAQLHLLKVFAKIKTQKDFNELKKVLFEFYKRKVDIEVDKIWNKKKLSNEKLDEFLKSHKRTPYK